MIILSCDHAGFDYMQKLIKFFETNKMEFKYMGPTEFNKDDDYPDFIAPASKEVLKDEDNWYGCLCSRKNRYKR